MSIPLKSPAWLKGYNLAKQMYNRADTFYVSDPVTAECAEPQEAADF